MPELINGHEQSYRYYSDGDAPGHGRRLRKIGVRFYSVLVHFSGIPVRFVLTEKTRLYRWSFHSATYPNTAPNWMGEKSDVSSETAGCCSQIHSHGMCAGVCQGF